MKSLTPSRSQLRQIGFLEISAAETHTSPRMSLLWFFDAYWINFTLNETQSI